MDAWKELRGFFNGCKSYLFYIEKRRTLSIIPPAFLLFNAPPPRQSNSPTQQLFLSLSTLFPSHPAPLHAHPHPPLTPVWGLCFIVNTPTPTTPVWTGAGVRLPVSTRLEQQNAQKRRGLGEGIRPQMSFVGILEVLVWIPFPYSFSCLFSSFLIKKQGFATQS